VSALVLDSATLADYIAVNDAAARALAVRNALADPVTVRVYDGGGQIMGQGTMAAPWGTAAGDTLTIGEVTAFNVLVSGTPDPSTWYLRFESGARWVRGAFGMSASGAAFRWSLASWSAGQLGTIGTATMVSHPGQTGPFWTIPDLPGVDATFNVAPGDLVPLTGLYDSNNSTPYFTATATNGAGQAVAIAIDSATGEITAPTPVAPLTTDSYDVVVDLTNAVTSTPLAVTLTLTGSGNVPYMATVYPLEGAVPSGQTITSADDANLRGSVLSAWPDGSAQVVVVAGKSNVSGSKAITLQSATVTDTPLTVQAIKNAVSTITTNFGSVQTLTLASVTPDWTWWANSQVICARYRLATGLGAMEAVIDIHAFADGRAFVEVVVENGKVNADAATVTSPATQTYTNATVAVNGTTIATVSSPALGMANPNSRRAGTYEAGGHEAGRAWYCRAEVTAGVASVPSGAQLFGLEVTHDTTSLQAVPFFFKPAVATSENLATKYAQTYDTYVPWSLCRLRIPGIDAGGDDQQLAPYTMEQSDYIVTGSAIARRAVLETTKALMTPHIHYRHTAGAVPTAAQSAGKSSYRFPYTWPRSPRTEPTFSRDASHIPAIGTVAFLCRPSPFIIELVQKFSIYTATEYNAVDGVHDYEQPRSRAWILRQYAQAVLLTPDSDSARKAGYRGWLYNSVAMYQQGLTQAWNQVRIFCGLTVSNGGNVGDDATSGNPMPRLQKNWYMHLFNAMTCGVVAAMKPLRDSAQVALLEKHADDVNYMQMKWFSDATAYEWRVVPYAVTIGTVVGSLDGGASGTSVDMGDGKPSTWLKLDLAGTPYTTPGPWMDWSGGGTNNQTLAPFNSFDTLPALTSSVTGTYGEPSYSSWLFGALVTAVERGTPGASAAWTKVYGTNGSDGGVTNLLTWRNGMATTPQANRWPRNI
jgi:hypothetical protein